MSFSPTNPVTGPTGITGLTSPTYTLTSDSPPGNPGNSKAYAVTALGGTQSNVDVHSASKPFVLWCSRPANIRVAPLPNQVSGIIPTAPRNSYSIGVRKGAVPVTGQAPQTMNIRCDFSVPAGSDVAEPEELRAAVALFTGALWQQAPGIAQMLIDGIIGAT
jgi:hypothetical protein